jgi:hypothetical protein
MVSAVLLKTDKTTQLNNLLSGVDTLLPLGNTEVKLASSLAPGTQAISWPTFISDQVNTSYINQNNCLN